MKSQLSLLAAVFFCFAILSQNLLAQCTTWLHPAPPSTYNDFNNTFAGAPCDAGIGCPLNEISAFEVYASEAYIASGFQAGGTYVFSICNGPGAGSWVPEFTILAPSGAVAAFGPGDGCAITWTAMESGSYKFIINEAGNCPGGPNQSVGNGHPALACLGGSDCSQANCKSGHLSSTLPAGVCGTNATFNVAAIGSLAPATGGYGWYFTDILGGTGGSGGNLFVPATTNANFDSDLNGLLSSVSLPVLAGKWVVKGAAYKLVDNPGQTFCSVSSDSLIVNFSPTLPPTVAVTYNGNGSATAMATGGTSPYSFLWSNGQTTSTATGLPTGDYSVVVTDANSCTGMASLSVISAVNDLDKTPAVVILPNPSSGQFLVKMAGGNSDDLEIKVFDMTGTLVKNPTSEAVLGQIRIDLTAQPDGVYFLKIRNGEKSFAQPLLLNH